MKTKNYLFKKLMKKRIFISIVTAGIALSTYQSNAQYEDCLGNITCVNPENSGVFSSGAANLSYDNIISGWHASATNASSSGGTISVWGERSKATGGVDEDNIVPTAVTPANGYNYGNANPLKIALGSALRRPESNDFTYPHQFILLTDDNKLWTWGGAGAVLSTSLVSNNSFTQVNPGNSGFNSSLPVGVNASDVKMLFATTGTLALTTCGGDVYVISQNEAIRQNNNSATSWIRIRKSNAPNDYLTNIIATRGTPAGLMALDANGNLWTWGYNTRKANGQSASRRNFATQMNLPNHDGTIKMIGATTQRDDYTTYNADYSKFEISYYVLYEDGNLFALGANGESQLGDWTTTNRNYWIQPRYNNANGPVMDNIAWISPQEHDFMYGFINVITKNKELYNWGGESGSALGRSVQGSTAGEPNLQNPGKPNSWEAGRSNDNILTVESGGHTTVLLKNCEATFGYIGHRTKGSMGDGSPASSNETDNIVQFNTNSLQVCGLPTIDGAISANIASSDNTYCNGSVLELTATPAGGVFSIISVDNQTSGSVYNSVSIDQNGNLNATGLTFPGSTNQRTVRVGYTVSTPDGCINATIQELFTFEECNNYTLKIPGNIWIDKNKDAIKSTDENNYLLGSEILWANLVDPNNKVIGKAKVKEDGTYEIEVNKDALAENGDYTIILTAQEKALNSNLNNGDQAGAAFNYYYTGTNRGSVNSANTNNNEGKVSLGNLRANYASSWQQTNQNSTADEVNFGVIKHSIILAKDDVNQTPMGIPVSGNILTNDKGDAPITITEVNGHTPNGNNEIVINTLTGVDTARNPVNSAGSIVIYPDGSYVFTPANGFVGKVDPLPYVIKDEENNEANATLNITVIPPLYPKVDSDPIAQDDYNLVKYNETGNGNILLNDSDPDGGQNITVIEAIQGSSSFTINSPITVSGVDADNNVVNNAGTITINEDGTYVFTPSNGFVGDIDPIHYTIEDVAGGKANAYLYIKVLPEDLDPNTNTNTTYANDDANIGPKGKIQEGNVLDNDFDPESNNEEVTSYFVIDNNGNAIEVNSGEEEDIYVKDPANHNNYIKVGTIIIESNGEYTYIPTLLSDGNYYVGTVTVPYSKCDDGNPIACDEATLYLTTLPVAPEAKDDFNQTPKNTPVDGDILNNDDGIVITVKDITVMDENGNFKKVNVPNSGSVIEDVHEADGTKIGTIEINENGEYTFTPEPEFEGKVPPIDYTIINEDGLTDTATLRIKVIPPIPTNPNQENSTNIIAQNDYNKTKIGVPVSDNALNNDSDPNLLSNEELQVIESSQGSTTITLGTSTQVSGIDRKGNIVPHAGDIVLNTDGTYTFTPYGDFVGNVDPIYYAIDNGKNNVPTANDDAYIYIIVTPENDGNNTTVANDDANSAPQGYVQSGNILDNDFDAEGDDHFVTGATVYSAAGEKITDGVLTLGQERQIPDVGEIKINTDGTYTFEPVANFYGTVVVPYTKCDNGNPQACDNATLYLTVMGDPAALPIKLASFEVEKQQFSAVLEWVTTLEENNDGFEVQKSADGKIWNSIAFVESKGTNGNSNRSLVYNYEDTKPVLGKNYYRLKQVDLDGNYEYSVVRTAIFDLDKENINIYPNPANSYVIIEGVGNANGVQIVNAVGQVVRKVDTNSMNKVKISVDDLQSGIYTIHIIQNDGSIKMEKILISK